MKRTGFVLALALVVLTDVWVLVGVARNRSGEDHAVLRLTERELPRASYFPVEREDTGLALTLSWDPEFVGDWLDEAKLAELGFDCSVPLDARSEQTHYGKLLPRRGWLVLEQDGAAWQRWLEAERGRIEELAASVERGKATAEQLEAARRRFEELPQRRSRLFAIDAGPRPDRLRQRYTDRARFAVVPAVFDLSVERPWDAERERAGPPRLTGRVERVLVASIHVPLRLREPFEDRGVGDDASGTSGPRYAVSLAFGRRGEPWIVSAERR